MPVLTEIPKGVRYFGRIFLRAEGDIFVPKPEDEGIDHHEFAEQEGILHDLLYLRDHEPAKIDGGKFSFTKGLSYNGTIILFDAAKEIEIPTLATARTISTTVFEQTLKFPTKSIGKMP